MNGKELLSAGGSESRPLIETYGLTRKLSTLSFFGGGPEARTGAVCRGWFIICAETTIGCSAWNGANS
jgi:hypothetical protein